MVVSHKFSLILCSCLTLLLLGCVPKYTTKGDKFPLMYEENPNTILVLPPINETTAADAKEYYSTTITEPLANIGYYVFSIEIASEILKMEGIYDTELLLNTPPQKFYEYFGADAVLYTTIKKWDLSYIVIASNLTVSIDFILKSTKTGETIWKYSGIIVVDLTGYSSSGNPLIDIIVKVVATAISSAASDYVPYAKQVNIISLQAMPVGKYHPEFLKDQSVKIVDK